MKQDLIAEVIRAATRMAADRGIDLDQAELKRAVLAVTGACDGHDEPEEIAEDALELLGKGFGPSASGEDAEPSKIVSAARWSQSLV